MFPTGLTRFASHLGAIGILALLPLDVAAQQVGSSPVHQVRMELGVRIPMRDGVKLAANLFRPDTAGKFPVILLRTPYGKSTQRNFSEGRWFAERGYIYIVEDCRGRHDSEGVFRPNIDDFHDGYDTIEWSAVQPWSNGNVGTLGGSYLGENQWRAATQRPPHLKTMIPLVSPPDPFFNIPYQYGAYSPMNLDWVSLTSDHDNQLTSELNLDEIYRHLPLLDMDVAAGRPSSTWREWVEHSTWDDYWKAQSYEMHYDNIDLPVLHISGWYDDDQPGTTRNYTAMRRRGRKNQRMLIGPWPHAVNSTTRLGPLDFGPSAQIDMRALLLRWFDHWLKAVDNGIDREPPVHIFVMGANVWRDEDDYPLPRTQFTEYFFHSGGRANSSFGDGSLSQVAPANESPDHYTYDPANATPFVTDASSAQVGGPDDYRPVERRDDVLVYTTSPLEHDIEITGPLGVKLWAASSAPDTDFAAMLLDVYPDGMAVRLNDGIIRASFRESLEKPAPLVAGKAYEYAIDCWATSMLIRKGHRIRVHIVSSEFPKFDRNLNTGHRLGMDAEMRTAEQTVYHDAAHPSRIVLPVIPAR